MRNLAEDTDDGMSRYVTNAPETAPIFSTKQLENEISDASCLLDYAVSSGFITEDGAPLPWDVISTIRPIVAKLEAKSPITPSEWARLDVAYNQLARLMWPITPQTLRDTAPAAKSPARVFGRILLIVTIFFAGFAVFGDWSMELFGPVVEGEVDLVNTGMQLVKILVPYAYGGLGSCVYLLRSAHNYIHERTFDVRREPEYWNRIILGTISGGAAILFVSQITTDESSIIHLSTAAIGFIAGYSTEFLFLTIERLIAAVLPRIDLQAMRRSPPTARRQIEIASGGVTLQELLDRFERADGSDKEMYRALIEKFKERI